MIREPAGGPFIKFLWCRVKARNDSLQALELARQFSLTPVLETVMKSAVAAGSTTDPTWAASLSAYRSLSEGIVSLIASQTLVGRLQGFVRAPFATRTLVETQPAVAQFRAQGQPLPVSNMGLASATLDFGYCAVLVVFTAEIFEFWSAASEANIRAALVRSVSRGIDLAFVEPLSDAEAGGRPASITFGISPVTSTGNNAAAITADLKSALGRMVANGSDLQTVSLLTHPKVALHMAGLTNADGEFAFPSVGVRGGSVWDLPLLTSNAIASSDSPPVYSIIAVDTSKILLADDSLILADVSTQASLQMLDNPISGAAQTVSLYQCNCAAVKVARQISWKRADDSAVEIISGLAA